MSVEVMQSPVPSPLFGDSGFIVHHIPRSFPTYHPCPADSAPFARLLAATRPLPVVETHPSSGARAPPPLSLLIVVRNSIGMDFGGKAGAIRAAAGAALARLTWRDTFAVVYFHSGAGCLVGYGPATPDRVALAAVRLAALTNDGASRMLGGLEVADALLRRTAGTGRRRVVLLLTDDDGEQDDSIPTHLRPLLSRDRAQRAARRARRADTLLQAWTGAGITVLGRGVALDRVGELVQQCGREGGEGAGASAID